MPHPRLFLVSLLFAVAPVLATPAGFAGADACRDCHATQFEHWRGSDHDLAMQAASAQTVLGDFDDARFEYNGVTTRFFQRDGGYFVATDGEDGKLTEYPVAYVFGHYPLQQYLLPLSRGRLQALSIAWDSRPQAEGGQRWYHLYPDEAIDHRDPLHWTGPYQNWNTRCAECHSTDLHKNYSATTRSFDTQYEELNVSCEACHGPGQAHVTLAIEGKLDGAADGGFPVHLAQRGTWAYPQGEAIARRREPLESRSQIDACGRCHSRRGTLGDYHYGADLLDTHRLALPRPPLYHVDGQILDEDYVYGSFTQSRMHMAGVVCSNCHEPHSAKLRAPGNAVCGQCHKPQVYDSEEHHFHPVGSAGAACANCHMPETTYMGVDPRRDHSLRVPRPDLSLVLGVPNACNQCHTDRSPDWALEALRKRGVQFLDTATHPARALAQLQSGDLRGAPRVAELAGDDSAPPLWRATAMEALGEVGGRDALQSVAQLLYHDDSLIRTSTVRATDFLPLHQRFQLLMPLVDDPVRSVRMEVAASLAGVPLEQVAPEQAAALSKLFGEYRDVLAVDADMPATQLQLGLFLTARGELPAAEAAYREALRLNPQLIGAYLNLADLMRGSGDEAQARSLLETAMDIAPDNGDVLHSLGLLETRTGNAQQALDYLGRAAALERGSTRHRFVYAIALHDLGQPREAVAQLEALQRQSPQDQQVLQALVTYCTELGDTARAEKYRRLLPR
ncbi:ammonia-forming cytochrome c nitrite reductase subunit c552 [Mangrovimicrobium sediminis]|uniref:Ammonia-forming cytochrome c nitrite reductase subunit c552 n=1 Tax=Mangrovimicrobium sediminis TaxID=2562682 RepID=A0A4Z0LZ92_9GAMM|nr:ammonia-forming cytochrome c nitrite reductase subunit c552 [Haliea sp. SAOS-164]TGD72703.1 ammonia-forming cytochrome c nitrite reductase subunit c552 [Haliea sp. SAOS-164]